VASKRARRNVRDLAPGDELDQVLQVREANVAMTKRGSPYIRAELADRTGSITAIQWDAGEQQLADYPQGGYVRVRGAAESYKSKVNLKVQSARAADPAEVDRADFLVTTERDVKELRKELGKLVRSVKDADLSKVLRSFFDDKEFLERFAAAPGATSYHHACAGGLMEHTVAVAGAAAAVGGRAARLDRDRLVTGALLHDIGKTMELSPEAGFERTDAGNLVGHVVLGALMLEGRIAKLDGFPEPVRLELLHLLLSHHGQREWGSPVLPATREALALHHIDNLDAKVQAADAAIRGPAAPGASWTEYSKMLGVRVWRGREGD